MPVVGFASTSSARPAHIKEVARVITMSGTRVRTMIAPLSAPARVTSNSTINATPSEKFRSWPTIARRESTLARAIKAPTERSMPPPSTTMVCATAANARGAFSVRLGGRHLVAHPAAEQPDDAVEGELDLRQLGREQQPRRATGGQLLDQAVDLALGSDVDASRGIETQQRLETADEPSRDADLLLVAA